MKSPFVFPVAELTRPSATMPEERHQTGPSPSRIGPEMIAIAEGAPVDVDATLTPIGAGVLVDATITATLSGNCVRCLRELTPDFSLHVSQMFVADADVITGDDAEDDDEVPLIVNETIDLEQTVIDEAVLALPFNPTCEGQCPEGESDVPEPDGVSGERVEGSVDPRWAGLEKFL
ncbi:YceD family protein [Corynebacterium uterequi]|uniref:Putative metal-binding protein, possibly nucleic-acid binding n=1 Tax=Corynebacterium uterequi TaxID=1072256 RepID=A0A0G3HDE3_9CORY|nr:YceD family protein [Corynebacterium uterequi]AKK11401.1 putative metal-binding protein, possibly nucleic-acid binding [Corynebacterium uterequi]